MWSSSASGSECVEMLGLLFITENVLHELGVGSMMPKCCVLASAFVVC